MFVVARIASTTQHQEMALRYLHSALGEANLQRLWAEHGIKLLENGRNKPGDVTHQCRSIGIDSR
jgi:hypothetical protein